MSNTSRPASRLGLSLLVLMLAACETGLGQPPLGGTGPASPVTSAPAEASSAVIAPAATVPPAAVPPVATPSPAAEHVPALARPFAIDLYRPGDFVAQYTFDWCVGASLQMMLNLVRPGAERSRLRQQQLWELARARSASYYGGANPRGWTAALNELGVGPYALVGVTDYATALGTAATALRRTGRPVGLVMWGGRHAWVMSGFTSRGDPLTSAGFVVTGVRVLDPLYPSGSSTWGPSPRPDTLLSPAALDDTFVPRHGRRQPDYAAPGSYVLVLPLPASDRLRTAGPRV